MTILNISLAKWFNLIFFSHKKSCFGLKLIKMHDLIGFWKKIRKVNRSNSLNLCFN